MSGETDAITKLPKLKYSKEFIDWRSRVYG